MKKPVIGILPTHNSKDNVCSIGLTYLEVIETAGGTPIVLPHTSNEEVADELTDICDGFLFSGGPDVDPRLYGENPWYKLGALSPMRDTTDPLFFKYAYKKGKPILGICRGIQLINACLGGTLYQDLPSQFKTAEGVKLFTHNQDQAGIEKTHYDTAAEGSLIAQCYGTRFMVNSFHHQAVKDIAPGCVVTAWSEDGVPEALTMPGYGFLEAVQWHPEILAPQCDSSRKLFKAFVDACK